MNLVNLVFLGNTPFFLLAISIFLMIYSNRRNTDKLVKALTGAGGVTGEVHKEIGTFRGVVETLTTKIETLITKLESHEQSMDGVKKSADALGHHWNRFFNSPFTQGWYPPPE